MNKRQFAEALVADLDAVGVKVDAIKADKILTAVLGRVIRTVSDKEKVSITGFGAFDVATVAARKARNPQTGQTVEVGETTKIRFRPGARFTDIVRGDIKLPPEGQKMTLKKPKTVAPGQETVKVTPEPEAEGRAVEVATSGKKAPKGKGKGKKGTKGGRNKGARRRAGNR